MFTVQYVCLCLPMEVKFRNVFLETKLTLKPGVTKITPSLLFEDFTGSTLVYLAFLKRELALFVLTYNPSFCCNPISYCRTATMPASHPCDPLVTSL